MAARRVIRGLWEAVEQKQARGRVERVAQSAIDLNDIKTLNNAISSLLELFQVLNSSELFDFILLTTYSLKVVLLPKLKSVFLPG